MNYFLGMDVHIGEDCLLLGQNKYISEQLLKVRLLKASPLPTPMSSNFLSKIVAAQQSSPRADVSLYMSTIVALQHVCIIRPDIHFAMNKLSQFMQQPFICHWKVVLRVLRYFKGTIDHGLLFRVVVAPSSKVTLLSFADVDRGSDLAYRRYVYGQYLLLNNNPIVWS